MTFDNILIVIVCFQNSYRNEDMKRKAKSSDATALLELEKQKKINRELYNLYVRKEFIAAFSSD